MGEQKFADWQIPAKIRAAHIATLEDENKRLLALLDATEARARALEAVAEAARGLWSGWERDGLDYWIDQLGRALAGDGGAA